MAELSTCPGLSAALYTNISSPLEQLGHFCQPYHSTNSNYHELFEHLSKAIACVTPQSPLSEIVVVDDFNVHNQTGCLRTHQISQALLVVIQLPFPYPISSLAVMPYPQLCFAGSFLWKIWESSNENSPTLCENK